MASNWYVLGGKDGRTPIPATLEQWAHWIGCSHDVKHLARSEIGDALVSTVFLGLDHNHGNGPPLLFETMVFGGAHDGFQDRCSTWRQAEKMHEDACARVRGAN